MIKAEKLVRKFKTGDLELIALKGVSFEIRPGEFLSIIGRSGSGKSTLLYQLGLLDHPTSGKIYLDGTDTSELNEDDRTNMRLKELGYIFQDYALVPELTSVENVQAPLLMQGLSKIDSRKQAVKSLEKVGLGDRLKNLPNQLSGGEQQRVSIARAIGHNPKILFADEPTANLDNETALSVLKVFKDLHEEGQTIIMVTHEKEYAAITNRTITLFDGEIISDERNRK